MARFCSNCGAALEGGAKFCANCGAAEEAAAISHLPMSRTPPPAAAACNTGLLVAILVCVAVLTLFSAASFLGLVPGRGEEAAVPEPGDKVLIVETTSDSEKNVSGKAAILEALEKGGRIVLNPRAALRVDPGFEDKYAVSNSNGKYFTQPALLNFVGAHGWRFQTVNISGDAVFVKSRLPGEY